MSENELPNSVRYVKNGRGGRLPRLMDKYMRDGKACPTMFLQRKDLATIELQLKRQYGERLGAKQDFNQIRYLLDSPSMHVWVTFEDDSVWRCTVRDDVTVNGGAFKTPSRSS